MEAKIYQQSGEIRCYRCGSTEIEAICHHCGRPMCSKHDQSRPAISWFTENREFKNLTMGIWPLTQREGAHCEFHVHSNLNYRRVLIFPALVILVIALALFLYYFTSLAGCFFNRPQGTIDGLAGLAEILRDPSGYTITIEPGLCYSPQLVDMLLNMVRYLVLVGISIPVLLTGIQMNRDTTTADISGKMTEVPFGLASDGIEIVETMKARINLDALGKATAITTGDIIGEIRPGLHFTALDKRRLQEYKTKYGLGNTPNLSFQAGYLLLRGRPNIILELAGYDKVKHLKTPEARYYIEGSNMIWLEGQENTCAYLVGGKGSLDTTWPRTWHYRIGRLDTSAPRISWGDVPVRIVPYLLESGNNRSVSLQIQFNRLHFPWLSATPDNGNAAIGLNQVIWLEQAQVWVNPQQFGRPESSGVVTELERDTGDGAKACFQIDWRGLGAKIDPEISFLTLPPIHFDQAIPDFATLTGCLRLRIPALISGMKTAQYFSALGYPVRDRKRAGGDFPCEGTTYIDMEFSLTLAHLPTSILTSLASPTIELAGGPTPQRIRAILDALDTDASSGQPVQHMYARRVVESIPTVSEYSNDAGRWHWDISGREYHQTFPIDFHLVIYGQGDNKQGTTHVDMSVQGQVFDDESMGYLEAAQEGLREIILQAVKVSK